MEGQFFYPHGVVLTISKNGHILVTDHQLQKLTFDGLFVKSVGSIKSGSSQLLFNTPKCIRVHPTTGQILFLLKVLIIIFKSATMISPSHTLHGDKTFNYPSDVSLDDEAGLLVCC